MNSFKEKLMQAEPLMACKNKVEFQQRLQWLSEGMLSNHINSIVNYRPDQAEIALYRQYKHSLNESSPA